VREFGSVQGAIKEILTDFFKHAFDGSGGECVHIYARLLLSFSDRLSGSSFDAGSSIGSRLTSGEFQYWASNRFLETILLRLQRGTGAVRLRKRRTFRCSCFLGFSGLMDSRRRDLFVALDIVVVLFTLYDRFNTEFSK
jgi:hypothetical protein